MATKVVLLTSPPLLSVFHSEHSLHHKPNNLHYPSNNRRLHRRKTVPTIVSQFSRQGGGLENEVMQVESTTLLNVTSLVTVKFNSSFSLKRTINQLADVVTNPPEGSVFLQLLSQEVHPETMKPKMSKKVTLKWSKKHTSELDNHTYKVDFKIDPDFGTPGAILVTNQYQDEFFLMSISVVQGDVHFTCRSWIQPVNVNPETRIFFTSKAYLPAKTPMGLIELRKAELKNIQGDGTGLRLPSDRIYDYDVYNDLGNPDKGMEYARPTLGGENNPHPRRCRTGRPHTAKDEEAEIPAARLNQAYVPRDEDYEKPKKDFLFTGALKLALRNLSPVMIAAIFGEKTFYVAVDEENKNKSNLQILSLDEELNRNLAVNILNKINGLIQGVLKLDPPKYISKDQVWGLPDEEFGRRVLAGVNPGSIEKLKSYPPVSKLDESIYGPQESALKEKHIIGYLEGMSVQQALDENKLFILDFHDMYLPFVDKINAIEGRKAYATRTIFFLTPLGTLKPIAIELSLPSAKKVVTPSTNGTTDWLWQLAKEHVCSNDTAIHTLVNHWLRIHACMEPFFIAAHRNLSVIYPIFKLLGPHMRYLIKTNGFSRSILINAGAVIETFNSPGKYSMQVSCIAYRDWWRFDKEGLPADLLRRNMVVLDPTKPHGIRLEIEDYPYAQDGLLIWKAIENLVKKYVNHYYPGVELVQNDMELQCWYAEAVNIGHADVRNATWWPKLSTPDDLINIITTIIWTVTGQHAVLNFGQYPYGAYILTRPSFMRRLLPSEHDPDYKHFMENPKVYFLSSIPSLTQGARYTGVLDAASGHSPDEEYIGDRKDLSSWSDDQEILEAFNQFSMDIKFVEQEIAKRNSDPQLRNRCGDQTFPFELLIPTSGPGTTSRGVPNSVTA